VDSAAIYYRLRRVDGEPLPATLSYNTAECVVTDGDIVIRPDLAHFGGDGIICVRLIGSAFGHPQVHEIFLQRESYDRIDSDLLTFPGGHRHKQGMTPDMVAHERAGWLELVPIRSAAALHGLNAVVGKHEWSFERSNDLLPGSEASPSPEE